MKTGGHKLDTLNQKAESPNENHLGIQRLTMAGLTGLEFTPSNNQKP